jgi:hypothetical protein
MQTGLSVGTLGREGLPCQRDALRLNDGLEDQT